MSNFPYVRAMLHAMIIHHVILQGINPSAARAAQTHQDPAAVVALKKMKDRVQSEIQRYRGTRSDPRPQRPPHMSDFARLARRICGKSIGVVLGGGGARGISHLVRQSSAAEEMHAHLVPGCPPCPRGVWHSCGSCWRLANPRSHGLGEDSHEDVGTSIGAFIGGLYAREGDIISSSGRAKQFSARMGNIWRMLSDVTYPIVAYTTAGIPLIPA